jgi:hypothetical protein
METARIPGRGIASMSRLLADPNQGQTEFRGKPNSGTQQTKHEVLGNEQFKQNIRKKLKRWYGQRRGVEEEWKRADGKEWR